MRRDPVNTKEALLRAGVLVLEDHYTDEDGDRPPLPITVAEVLKKVRDLPWPDGGEPRELTTGAVAAAFGSRVEMMEAIAARMIDPDRMLGELKVNVSQLMANVEDPAKTRRRLSLSDIENATASVAATRHWFAAHSQAANSSIAAQIEQVYRGFDELLVPLYAYLGELEGRTPKKGMSWPHVATALTAWTEGIVLRAHYGKDGYRDTPWQTLEDGRAFFGDGAEALWFGLTVAKR